MKSFIPSFFLFSLLGLFLSFFSIGGLLLAQNQSFPIDQLPIQARYTDKPIVLDGKLEEEIWEKTGDAVDFHQYFPDDKTLATDQSEIKITYDDDFLYLAVICHSPDDNYMITSLRRDFRGSNNDGITFVFDPFLDQTNAFFFSLTPFGVMREGLIFNGGSNRGDFSTSWDNKWYAESKVYDKYWVGEIAIPFKTLRFKEGGKRWKFNSYRIDTHANERSSWTYIPRNQSVFSLAFMGDLEFEKPLKKAGGNLAIIPYLAGGVSKDFEEGDPSNLSGGVGADAKIALSSSLNLDLTFNPDFSQVEVDQQVTNLDRFEIFFPERRQFFLENADLFSNFGTNRVRPFFSRRIGIAYDSIAESNVQTSIPFGARLSGKLNRDWRIGLLNMTTQAQSEVGIPATNYSVAAIQRRVFQRSNFGGILVNRQSFGESVNSFNRVAGIDYNHATVDNRWAGKVFYHKSFSSEQEKDAFSHGLSLNFNSLNVDAQWNHQWVGEGFEAATGFVPRQGFFRMSPGIEFKWYPKSEKINRFGVELEADYLTDQEVGKLDHEYSFNTQIRFQNQSFLFLRARNSYTYLTGDFDPSRSEGKELLEGTDYSYSGVGFWYRSDSRKLFSYQLEGYIGEYFNGNRQSVGGELTFRYQPYALISLNFNYNHISLPEPYATADLILIGPRVDITFTRTLFFTTFIQYNNQVDNININARFQWRFKPVSDLFIVYTDNYYPSDFSVKTRALVLKLTYWLSI